MEFRSRPVATLVLIAVWALVTIGRAFGFAEPGPFYVPLTIAVFLIIGLMWDVDLTRLLR